VFPPLIHKNMVDQLLMTALYVSENTTLTVGREARKGEKQDVQRMRKNQGSGKLQRCGLLETLHVRRLLQMGPPPLGRQNGDVSSVPSTAETQDDEISLPTLLDEIDLRY
jgi:hypothetical protein